MLGSRRTGVVPLLIVIILILGAAWAYTYEQDFGTISSLDHTVTSQRSLINSQVSQLSLDLAKVSNLTMIVTSIRTQVKTLGSEITADEARISSLTSGYAQANTTIGSLQSQVASLNSQIGNLDAQVATLDNQIAAYQSEVTSLQVQVRQLVGDLTAINVALGQPVAQLMVSDETISVPSGSAQQFNFTSTGVGSVLVVGVASSTSPNTIVSLAVSTDPLTWDVGSSGIAAFNIIEGWDDFNVSISSQNTSAFTATINIWYFYGVNG
jgi:uncharacterized coiled-coil protein SlyX